MKANGALSLFLSLMLIFSLAPVVSAEEPQPVADAVFTDLAENAWYAADIAAVASSGLMTGGAGNSFSPEAPMTRAMAVTTLFRLAHEPDAAQSPFSDVPADCWYEHAVNWAWENGITQGSSASCFSPDRVCTPQEAAEYCFRLPERLEGIIPASAHGRRRPSPGLPIKASWITSVHRRKPSHAGFSLSC